VLYRLNGDKNPLHIDPKVAQKAKFERPILHGLCTFGFSSRAIYEKYGNNDPTTISKIAGRFTSHVYPGETLLVEMWKVPGSNKVYFET
jgi:acyl dehydratase